MKLLSNIPQTDSSNIHVYANYILTHYPDIVTSEVKIQGIDSPMKPFEGWDKNNSSDTLKGWNAYNNVKHGRVANIKDAKLEYVLNLLACLYVIENYLLKKFTAQLNEMDILDEDSKVFTLLNWHRRYIPAKDLAFKSTENGEPILGGGGA